MLIFSYFKENTDLFAIIKKPEIYMSSHIFLKFKHTIQSIVILSKRQDLFKATFYSSKEINYLYCKYNIDV